MWHNANKCTKHSFNTLKQYRESKSVLCLCPYFRLLSSLLSGSIFPEFSMHLHFMCEHLWKSSFPFFLIEKASYHFFFFSDLGLLQNSQESFQAVCRSMLFLYFYLSHSTGVLYLKFLLLTTDHCFLTCPCADIRTEHWPLFRAADLLLRPLICIWTSGLCPPNAASLS